MIMKFILYAYLSQQNTVIILIVKIVTAGIWTNDGPLMSLTLYHWAILTDYCIALLLCL